MRSWPRQLARISINTGGQPSFWQAFSELQSSLVRTAVSQFCAQVWRRAAVAVAAASRFRFGLDYLLVVVWTI
jgi:hypothetical protein